MWRQFCLVGLCTLVLASCGARKLNPSVGQDNQIVQEQAELSTFPETSSPEPTKSGVISEPLDVQQTIPPDPLAKPDSELKSEHSQAPIATAQTKPKHHSKETAKKPSVPVHRNQEKQSAVRQKQLSLAELVKKYPAIFKLHGSKNEKKVALTFDDGPDVRFTPKILDILKENNVKATFFIVGKRALEDPEVVRRIVKEGHIIGNHSYSHANLPKLNEEQFQEQILSTEFAIKQIIGYAPKLIRPPYGAINEEQVKWASRHDYVIVNWNVDSLDWKQLAAEQVIANIMAQTKPGSIILQHSGGAESQDLSGTVHALPTIISELKSSGYQLVTLPELLHVPKSK